MDEMNEQSNNKIFETNSSSQNILNNFGKIPLPFEVSYNLENKKINYKKYLKLLKN